MARLLLADGEDSLARFHPHRASLLADYAASLLWLAYGWAGWTVAKTQHAWLGLLVVAALAAAHGTAARLLRFRGLVQGILWAAVALALMAAVLQGALPSVVGSVVVPLGLGVAAFLLALALAEAHRARHVTDVTSRRIVLRGGVGTLVERTIPLVQVQGVRALQPPLGQLFGYGTLVVTLERKGRAKPGDEAPHEKVSGVPNWEVVKHRLEVALEDLRLSPKERVKRAEERRLKESMHALAGWAAGGGSPPP